MRGQAYRDSKEGAEEIGHVRWVAPMSVHVLDPIAGDERPDPHCNRQPRRPRLSIRSRHPSIRDDEARELERATDQPLEGGRRVRERETVHGIDGLLSQPPCCRMTSTLELRRSVDRDRKDVEPRLLQ